MRKLFTLLPVLLIPVQKFYAQPPSDWQIMELRGKVKSLKVKETHRYKKDGVNFTEWANSHAHTYFFNKDGRKTEYQHYEEDGTLGYKAVYAAKPGADNTREEIFFNKEGTETSRTVYQFNEKGKLIEESQYNPGGSLVQRYASRYDEKGNLVERNGFRPDGSISSTTRWVYDTGGKNIERNDNYFIHRFVYDAQGNKTEEIVSKSNNTFFYRLTFKYDENGNKAEELKYNEKGLLKDKNTWRYEYDKKGNWTKRIQSGPGGEDFFIEERTITYY